MAALSSRADVGISDDAFVSKKPINIGINILFLIPGNVGGTEIYTRQILRSLAALDKRNRYFVFRNAETDSTIVPNQANFYDRPQNLRATSRVRRLAYEQTVFLFALRRSRIDVLFNLGFTAPLLAWMPMVTTCYDFNYKHFARSWKLADLTVARILYPMSARRSAWIVCMSESVIRDLRRFYPWAENRITIIPHSCDADLDIVRIRRASNPATAERFILAVSSVMPHKNYDNLFLAYARFRETHPDVGLVVVGVRGLSSASVEALRSDLGLETCIRITGWIDRVELLELFVRANALVYASRFEGFGIPILEALTGGIPLACSDIEPAREIAGSAARYFDPNDVDDISRALSDVMDDEALRARLSNEGFERSERYDARTNAEALINVFERISSVSQIARQSF